MDPGNDGCGLEPSSTGSGSAAGAVASSSSLAEPSSSSDEEAATDETTAGIKLCSGGSPKSARRSWLLLPSASALGWLNPGGGRMCRPGGLVKTPEVRQGVGRDGSLAIRCIRNRGTEMLISSFLPQPAGTFTCSVESISHCDWQSASAPSLAAAMASADADVAALTSCRNFDDLAFCTECPGRLASKLGTVESKAMMCAVDTTAVRLLADYADFQPECKAS